MANNMSNWLENQLRDFIFRTAPTFTKPTVLAIALSSIVPTGTLTGANMNELANVGAYARQTLNPLDANWSILGVTTSGTVSNASIVTFPQCTADLGWTSGGAILDSATYGVGNPLFWFSLTNPREIKSSDQFTIAVSGLQISFD